MCQATTFRSELSALRAGTSTRHLPLIRPLDLFLADDLLCCGGRLDRSALCDSARHPILLPTRHPFTKLMIDDVHRHTTKHSGVNAVITALRQRVWIPAVRQQVKTCLRTCVPCRRASGKPYPAPRVAPLPAIRSLEAHPFHVTGVDFTGALTVRTSHGTNSKAYVCLFTGAVIRAVHLELVPDLTVDEFMQAFRRFASRRSLPRLHLSDNASTF